MLTRLEAPFHVYVHGGNKLLVLIILCWPLGGGNGYLCIIPNTLKKLALFSLSKTGFSLPFGYNSFSLNEKNYDAGIVELNIYI